MNIKVAIYEDNHSLRETLSYLIMGTDSLELTGAFPDCSIVMENCASATPDVILMDIDMPGITGIEATAMVKARFPEINILIFTVFEDRDKVFKAQLLGSFEEWNLEFSNAGRNVCVELGGSRIAIVRAI